MPAASGSTHSTRPGHPAPPWRRRHRWFPARPADLEPPSTRSGRRTGACTWIVPSATRARLRLRTRASSDRARTPARTPGPARSRRAWRRCAGAGLSLRQAGVGIRRRQVHFSRIGAPPRPAAARRASRQHRRPQRASPAHLAVLRPQPGAAMRSAAIDSSPCAAPQTVQAHDGRSNRTPATSSWRSAPSRCAPAQARRKAPAATALRCARYGPSISATQGAG